MSRVTTYAELRDRFEADRGEGGDNGSLDQVAARLEQALDAIGWRAADGASAEEVAVVGVHVLRACVDEHRDLSTARRALADLLYSSAAPLDGSRAAPMDFLPAASEVLRRYVGA
ncbi:MAG: hypothetical protein ABJA80_08405 [bacterium]